MHQCIMSQKALLFSLILMMVIFNCSCCTDKGGKNKSGITVGLIVKSESNSFFSEVEETIRVSAQEKGIRVSSLAPATRDEKKQALLLKTMLKSDVNAIILAPENSTSCIPEVIEAHEKKIPVILIDTDLDREKAPVTTLIACDNVEGGKIAADYLAVKMEGKGTVLILEGSPDGYNGSLRIKGFREVMDGYRDIRILISPPARFNRTKAFQICRNIFESRKDIKGVFALNDEMALGVYDALLVSKVKKPFVIGFNATKAGIEAIRKGRLDATVNQFQKQIGSRSVECAIKAIEGEKLPPYIYIKPELVTKERLGLPFQ